MKRCEYCKSRSILELSNKYYCETCEIYYKYRDNIQEYSNLPIEEIDQMTVEGNICKRCRPKYLSEDTVTCITYKQYFKRLPLCLACKKKNEKCIKNGFFRNFILYKMYARIFSIQHVVSYALCFYFLGAHLLYNLVSVNLIDYRRGEFGIVRNLLVSVVVVALHYWSCGAVLCCVYCLASMLFGRRWFYKVPVNLDRSPNLLGYLEQLKIGNSKRKSHA